ncbi:MAG: hypothetical protein ABIP38_10630 [Steroidobacteraceae bacterium]
MDAVREALALLESMGVTLPTPAYLCGVLLFGTAGMVLFWQGRRRRNTKVKWIGLALMLYPYVIWGTVPVYVVGAALCIAAWWYWNH